MAIGLYFTPSSFTVAKYDESIKKLEEAGRARRLVGCTTWLWRPTVQSRSSTSESQELFEAFGQTLLPILAEFGADPGTPQISNVRNVIEG